MLDPATILALIVNHLWQSAVLAGVLWALLVAARRLLSAQARHALAFGALVAAAALPLAMLLPGNQSLIETIAARSDRALPMQLDRSSLAVATPAADPKLIAERARGSDTTSTARATRNGVSASWSGSRGSWSVSLEPSARAAPDNARPAARTSSPAPAPTAAPEAADGPGVLARIGGQIGGRIGVWTEAARATLARPALAWGLLGIWLLVTVALLARTAADALAAERLRARATPVALPRAIAHLIGELDVRETPEAPGPMVASVIRPTILLPEGLAHERSAQELLGLIAHERAHIERGDLALALVQRILIALAWWSPAMHWIAARVEEEREMACDEAAAAHVGDARAFARALTAHAEAQLLWGWPRLVVGATRSKSLLCRRVRRLLEIAATATPPMALAGRACAAVLVAVIAAAALATPRLEAQDSDDRRGRTFRGVIPAVPAVPAVPRVPAVPAVPAAPNALPVPAAPMIIRDPQDVRRAAREVNRAEARMSRAAERLEEALDELEDDPSRSRDVRRATDDLAEAREELRRAATELDVAVSAMAGISQSLRHVAPGSMDAGRAAQTLAGRIAAAVGDVNVAVDIDPESFSGSFSGLNALAQLSHSPRGVHVYADWTGAWGGGTSPLLLAAQMGDHEMVELLIDAGADPNVAPDGRDSALNYAIRSGELELAELLLEHGADPNRTIEGQPPPLLTAVQMGEVELIEALLDAGADPNASSQYMGSPLMTAVRMGETEIARMLIAAGADVDGVSDERRAQD
jgi:beta-lactamase regulating signal transducer with metallopeptidase domain